jgi:hypothetical protein
VYLLPIFAWPGSFVEPPPKVASAIREAARRVMKIHTSWGDDHLFQTDVLFALRGPRDPMDWLLAARARNAVAHLHQWDPHAPPPPPAHRATAIRWQWERALQAVEEAGLTRDQLLARFDSLAGAQVARKALRRLRKSQGLPAGRNEEEHEDPPDSFLSRTRNLPIVSSDGSALRNEDSFGAMKRATFAASLRVGSARRALRSGFVHPDVFSAHWDGSLSGSSGSGEAKGAKRGLDLLSEPEVGRLPDLRTWFKLDYLSLVRFFRGEAQLRKEVFLDHLLWKAWETFRASGRTSWHQHVRGHTGEPYNVEVDWFATLHHQRPGLEWRGLAHNRAPAARFPPDWLLAEPPQPAPPSPAPDPEEGDGSSSEEEGELEEIHAGGLRRRRPGLQSFLFRVIRAHRWLQPPESRPAAGLPRRWLRWGPYATPQQLRKMLGSVSYFKAAPHQHWTVVAMLLYESDTRGRRHVRHRLPPPRPPCAFGCGQGDDG